MKSRLFALLAFELGCVLVSAASADDANAIQGTWIPSEASVSGQKLPAEQIKDNYLVLNAESYVNQTKNSMEKGTFAITPQTEPKMIDLTVTDGPNKGRTFAGIYKLAGNSLTICIDISGKSRPTSFASDNVGPLMLLVKYDRNVVGRR